MTESKGAQEIIDHPKAPLAVAIERLGKILDIRRQERTRVSVDHELAIDRAISELEKIGRNKHHGQPADVTCSQLFDLHFDAQALLAETEAGDILRDVGMEVATELGIFGDRSIALYEAARRRAEIK